MEPVADAAVPDVAADADPHSAEQFAVHDETGGEVVAVFAFQVRDDLGAGIRRELGPDAGQKIVENLKRRYGTDLTARFVVNPELLGGMRIRVGSDVWDSSVRNRLHRLQQQL